MIGCWSAHVLAIWAALISSRKQRFIATVRLMVLTESNVVMQVKTTEKRKKEEKRWVDIEVNADFSAVIAVAIARGHI